MKSLWLFSLVAVAASVSAGCTDTGCLNGQPGCKIPTPCSKITFQCTPTSGALAIKRIEALSERPGGTGALGAVGDILMKNQFAEIVISDLGRPYGLDPGGGVILDVAVPGVASDGLNNIIQAVGVLPRDSFRYQTLEIIDERPNRVAVQVTGTLDGQPKIRVATRYELQPCDKGVRVRSEVLNGGVDPQLYALVDGILWSKRKMLPFGPGQNGGYFFPSFGLTTINDVFRTMPYFAAAAHNGERSSIAVASCTDKELEGFHSEVITAAGLPRKVVQPRGLLIYERFLAVADGKSPAQAGEIALDVRSQVTKEALTTLTGRVTRALAVRVDSDRETSVVVSEGSVADPVEKRVPWANTLVSSSGTFAVKVPAGKKYMVEVHSFGRKQIERDLPADSTNFGDLVLPSTGVVTVNVRDGASMMPLDAMVFVLPADAATRANTEGTFHGTGPKCTPWLGAPPGASPACNRILTFNGTAQQVEVPMGRYHFYAFHGPFWSLDRKTVDVGANTQVLDFSLRRTGVQPAGVLSSDLHVHGAASFDSSIPDLDRVQSFLASDMDVIIATDHDVVYDYAATAQQLGTTNRMSIVAGVETIGYIPWLKIPNYPYPLVVGHYNFWPLKFDPLLPRNGGPEDEFVEPGQIFDNALAFEPDSVPAGTQLRELNHPWAAAEFGRDMGFPRAIFLDLRKDLPADDDGTNQGVYVRKPQGSTFRNHEHDAQEVMNGTQNDALLQYRAFWWYTLNQGQLKAGTANSDSHSLYDSVIGMPRTMVAAGTAAGPMFDVVKFNAAIRAGKVLGTNGPMIEATVETPSGDQPYGFALLRPQPGAKVKLRVTSAPWIPVKEIRFVVNGQVVKTLTPTSVAAGDPFGVTELQRYQGEVVLDELLAGVSGDAWLSIEAGDPMPLAGDLGGGLDDGPDGMPDTTDNNGDGKVDSADVEGDADAIYGPLKNPPLFPESDPSHHYNWITEGYPFAFTNPFIFDRNGDGAFNAPGVKGGRP